MSVTIRRTPLTPWRQSKSDVKGAEGSKDRRRKRDLEVKEEDVWKTGGNLKKWKTQCGEEEEEEVCDGEDAGKWRRNGEVEVVRRGGGDKGRGVGKRLDMWQGRRRSHRRHQHHHQHTKTKGQQDHLLLQPTIHTTPLLKLALPNVEKLRG